MCIELMTTLEKIEIPPYGGTLEQWNGQEYAFYGFEQKYTSSSFCYTLKFKKMVSDGLSIPQQLRDRVERMGRHLNAGLPHDAFYAGEIIPRDEADWIFLEILQFKDQYDRIHNPKQAPSRLWGWTVRNGAWLAVKAGGHFVWNRHNVLEVANFREICTMTITECPNKLREKLYKHEQKMLKNGLPPALFFEC